MKSQFVISISREYGSGGHDISERIAKHYGIPLYDKNILDEIGKEKGVDMSAFSGADEKKGNVFTSRTVMGFNNSAEFALAQMQFDFIREKLESGESFVICGRCADYVLKKHPALISIFVLADDYAKTERIMKKFELSMPDAIERIEKQNRRRKEYHNQHCKTKWGDSRHYDMCINSSRLGVEGTADFLIDYIDRRNAD